MKMITELTRNAETEMEIVTTISDTPLGTNVLVTCCICLPSPLWVYLFVGSRQTLYRQFASYGKGVDHHKVGYWSTEVNYQQIQM